MGDLLLTNETDTVMEILLRPGAVDSAATQIFFLSDTSVEGLAQELSTRRASQTRRSAALVILDTLSELRGRYPDITR